MKCSRWIAVAVLALAACASQLEPAQMAISDIEAVMSAAGPEASKYVPEQLRAVRRGVDGLKASFNAKDYPAVLAGAPAVMSAAQALAGAAAAKQAEQLQALNGQWSGMAAELPDAITAIQNRIERLSSKTGRKPATGVDLDAARGALSSSLSLWSKAQAAFATGNLQEAVSAATTVRDNLAQLETMLQMPPPPGTVRQSALPR